MSEDPFAVDAELFAVALATVERMNTPSPNPVSAEVDSMVAPAIDTIVEKPPLSKKQQRAELFAQLVNSPDWKDAKKKVRPVKAASDKKEAPVQTVAPEQDMRQICLVNCVGIECFKLHAKDVSNWDAVSAGTRDRCEDKGIDLNNAAARICCHPVCTYGQKCGSIHLMKRDEDKPKMDLITEAMRNAAKTVTTPAVVPVTATAAAVSVTPVQKIPRAHIAPNAVTVPATTTATSAAANPRAEKRQKEIEVRQKLQNATPPVQKKTLADLYAKREALVKQKMEVEQHLADVRGAMTQ